MSFSVTILGSGAALPTANRNPTSQYIFCNDRHFLVDCGEGTQVQLRKNKIHIQKIAHIFISHLHGDHFFGLVGLLSTLHLLGRDKGITIYGPKELEQIIRLQLEVGGTNLQFELNFVVLNGKEHRLIYEDKLVEIWTFPLKHRIPTNGFLFKEKEKDRTLDADLFQESGLSRTLIPLLKAGQDVVLDDGSVVYAKEYTFAAKTPKSYAYCSDTCYVESILPFIQGADLLYHEATFMHALEERAKKTFHSTAIQAATIAKKAQVKKLLIGHLSSRYESEQPLVDEARTVFSNTDFAQEGMVFPV